ncbi:MAG: UDP-galactopyranose mutase [Ignavibacteriaceae bacterium]|nr:UDP-galactopyranose mutase [Ignavibacteriaceae bacterium]
MRYDYLIIGAGFAGSVMAERLASQFDKKILLVEKRNHIGGNAFDEYDEYGILVHKYGPHIFHTNSKEVFDYLSQFTEWRFYEHKVLANYQGDLFPIPINRTTINKFFDLHLTTEGEVKNFLSTKIEKRFPILNSEDIIINQVGRELFEAFFKNYTKKQWNLFPHELSPSVCGRIPVRFNDDSRYFTDKYQFMPKDGYTKMFEKMLSRKNIEIALNTDYKNVLNEIKFDKMIYTGPIDSFFDYEFGKLPYRSIKFDYEHYEKQNHQSTGQVNHVDMEEEFTRVTEYKYLTLQEAKTTTISREYSLKEGEPFYPIPTDANRALYLKYRHKTEQEKNVIFCGRLAEYQYYNMDQVVANCLHFLKSKADTI